jgi:hypothetical protein
MLELLIKLLDHLVTWGKVREENARKLFTDFVAPAFADFEVIHQGYVETFKEISDEIAKVTRKGALPHLKLRLLESLQVANRLTESDRSKLRQVEELAKRKELGPFIIAIVRYMKFNPEWEPGEGNRVGIGAQTIRAGVIGTIIQEIAQQPSGSVKEETKPLTLKEEKQSALAQLDQKLSQLQQNHQTVVAEHMKLKVTLLAPK